MGIGSNCTNDCYIKDLYMSKYKYHRVGGLYKKGWPGHSHMYEMPKNSPKHKFKAIELSYLYYSADFLPTGTYVVRRPFKSVLKVSNKLCQNWQIIDLL